MFDGLRTILLQFWKKIINIILRSHFDQLVIVIDCLDALLNDTNLVHDHDPMLLR